MEDRHVVVASKEAEGFQGDLHVNVRVPGEYLDIRKLLASSAEFAYEYES